MNTTRIYATLERAVSDPLSNRLAKVIEVMIESCPIGFPLEKHMCLKI